MLLGGSRAICIISRCFRDLICNSHIQHRLDLYSTCTDPPQHVILAAIGSIVDDLNYLRYLHDLYDLYDLGDLCDLYEVRANYMCPRALCTNQTTRALPTPPAEVVWLCMRCVPCHGLRSSMNGPA